MDRTIPGKPVEAIPGAILLDGFLQSFLLGTIINQVFKYWTDYRDDSWLKRLFVLSVIALTFAQTMLEDYKVWRTIVIGKPWSTSPIEWSDLFLNGLICGLCESFYIRRCWKMMNRSIWVLTPLSILSAMIMASNIYLAIAMGLSFPSIEGTNDTLTTSHFLLPSTIVAFSFWIFGSLVLESSVTAILMICLWRSRTGLAEVDKTVVHIIHITWESASLPSLCMIVAVGLYHAAPRMDDHLVLFFVLMTGKLYTFGMLRTLNSRQRLRERLQSQDHGRVSLSTFRWEAAALHSVTMTQNGSGRSVYLQVAPISDEGGEASMVSSTETCVLRSSTVTPVMDAQERGLIRNRTASGTVKSI